MCPCHVADLRDAMRCLHVLLLLQYQLSPGLPGVAVPVLQYTNLPLVYFPSLSFGSTPKQGSCLVASAGS